MLDLALLSTKASWLEASEEFMLKKINGKWVYLDPPKHPKCVQRINEHMEYLSKCYIGESSIFGACFIDGNKSPYWQYGNLITESKIVDNTIP